MFKNKLFTIIIAMLVAITLILVAFFALWTFMEKANQPDDPYEAARQSVGGIGGYIQDPETVKAQTVMIENIITNLADTNRVVKVSFAFELDSKKSKEEFELLDFKVKGIINKTLADFSVADITGSQGQEKLISALMNDINEILYRGKIRQIWLTDFVVN